jgi:hypothetical protein
VAQWPGAKGGKQPRTALGLQEGRGKVALSKEKTRGPTSYIIHVKRQTTIGLHTVAVVPFCLLAPLSFTWRGDQTDSPYHNPANRCCSLVIADLRCICMWNRRSCHRPALSFPVRTYQLLSVLVPSASTDPTTWRPSLSLQPIFGQPRPNKKKSV